MSVLAVRRSVVQSKKVLVPTTTKVLLSTSATPYTERQAALGRPLSPHVQIYKFPPTALTSITDRFCAIGMASGFAGLSALAAVGVDIPNLIYTAQDIIPGFTPLSKMLIAFPISFHVIAAIRHTAWHINPDSINTADATKQSYAAFAAAGVISLGAAAYTIKRPVKQEE